MLHFLSLYPCSFCLVFRSIILLEVQHCALRNHYAASSGKLSLYLLILFDILHQTSYFFVVLLLFHLFFQLLHLYLSLFCSIFHLYLPLLQSILYICCYFLDEFFYFFPIKLPISHFLNLLFLVFWSLLIVNLILALTKSGVILFQHLSHFSHHKLPRIAFCRPIYV